MRYNFFSRMLWVIWSHCIRTMINRTARISRLVWMLTLRTSLVLSGYPIIAVTTLHYTVIAGLSTPGDCRFCEGRG